MAANAQRVQSQPVAPVLQFCRAISSLCPAASHRRNLHANLEDGAKETVVHLFQSFSHTTPCCKPAKADTMSDVVRWAWTHLSLDTKRSHWCALTDLQRQYCNVKWFLTGRNPRSGVACARNDCIPSRMCHGICCCLPSALRYHELVADILLPAPDRTLIVCRWASAVGASYPLRLMTAMRALHLADWRIAPHENSKRSIRPHTSGERSG